MDYQYFGKKVRSSRKEKGLTQETLAEMANISASFLGHIERGTRAASIDTLIALSNALNISPEILLAADLHSSIAEHIVSAEIDQRDKLLYLLDLAITVISGEQ